MENQTLPPPIPKIKKKRKTSKWTYVLIGLLLICGFGACIRILHWNKDEAQAQDVDMTKEDFKNSFESENKLKERLNNEVIVCNLQNDKSSKGYLGLLNDNDCGFYIKKAGNSNSQTQMLGEGKWYVSNEEDGLMIRFLLISDSDIYVGKLSKDSLCLTGSTSNDMTFVNPKFANKNEKAEFVVSVMKEYVEHKK